MKKPHPADIAALAAIASADHFEVSLFHHGAHEVHPLKTLAMARQAGELMEQIHQNGRMSLVYAVSKEGRSFLVPRDYQAPATQEPVTMNGLQPTTNSAKAPSPPKAYTEKSNACRAARVALGKKAQEGTDFVIGRTANGDFIWSPTVTLNAKAAAATPTPEAGKAALNGPDLTKATTIKLGVDTTQSSNGLPAFLDKTKTMTADEIIAQRAKNLAAIKATGAKPAAGTKPTPPERSSSLTEADKKAIEEIKASQAKLKAEKTTERINKLRASKGLPPKASAVGERLRYDWKGAEEKAAAGKIPPKLDFSAETHTRFRPRLAEVEKLAATKDIAALKKFKWEGFVSSSPKAILRWRDLVVRALAAKV